MIEINFLMNVLDLLFLFIARIHFQLEGIVAVAKTHLLQFVVQIQMNTVSLHQFK